MYIEKISLMDYRNIQFIEIFPDRGVNLFLGENGQGKTNILESIVVCSGGRSHRTRIDKELISYKKEEAHISIIIKNSFGRDKIDVHIKKNGKKGIAVNGIPIKKYSQLFGILLTVLFSPEEMLMVKQGPAERRKFLDRELCQINSVYCSNIQKYYSVLKHRNNLLKMIGKGIADYSELDPWDEQLVFYGMKVIKERELFTKKIAAFASKIYSGIKPGDVLEIRYKPGADKDLFNKLKQNRDREVFLGKTLFGPHRDDFEFLLSGKELKVYGSQGEQRSAAIAVKLSEIEIIREETGQEPVLLLDDIFSELDIKRQSLLIEQFKGMQIFITSAEHEKGFIANKIFNVFNGQIVN